MQFITNPSLKVMISKCFGSLLLSKEIQKFCPEQETMINFEHLFKKKHNYIMAQCENTEAECIFVWVVSQKVKGHAIKCAVLNFRCSSYHRIQNLPPPNL